MFSFSSQENEDSLSLWRASRCERLARRPREDEAPGPGAELGEGQGATYWKMRVQRETRDQSLSPSKTEKRQA